MLQDKESEVSEHHSFILFIRAITYIVHTSLWKHVSKNLLPSLAFASYQEMHAPNLSHFDGVNFDSEVKVASFTFSL